MIQSLAGGKRLPARVPESTGLALLRVPVAVTCDPLRRAPC